MKTLITLTLALSAHTASAAVICASAGTEQSPATAYETKTTLAGLTTLVQKWTAKDSNTEIIARSVVRKMKVNPERIRVQTWPKLEPKDQRLKYILIDAYESGENYAGSVSIKTLRTGYDLLPRWVDESVAPVICHRH